MKRQFWLNSGIPPILMSILDNIYVLQPTIQAGNTVIKDAVHNSLPWKAVDIWAQQPIKWHPSLLCSWSTVLISCYCLWLSPCHYACFLLRGPGHWSSLERKHWTLNWTLKAEDHEEQVLEFYKKVHGIQIMDCTFKLILEKRQHVETMCCFNGLSLVLPV